jgi:hypothetical protein
MTPSKKLKPFMTYLDDADYLKLKKFAKSKKLTMARILREGLEVRMAQDNPYINGFNNGLNAATKAINDHQSSQMRFPSGQSFGDMMSVEIAKLTMRSITNESSSG